MNDLKLTPGIRRVEQLLDLWVAVDISTFTYRFSGCHGTGTSLDNGNTSIYALL